MVGDIWCLQFVGALIEGGISLVRKDDKHGWLHLLIFVSGNSASSVFILLKSIRHYNLGRGLNLLNTSAIIAELEAERDRLDFAIAALCGRTAKSHTLSGKPDGRRRRKKLSAVARKKIGDAMKKKWAERKKQAA
jgi:hypothetical protein